VAHAGVTRTDREGIASSGIEHRESAATGRAGVDGMSMEREEAWQRAPMFKRPNLFGIFSPSVSRD
jgi:hypothetical protein